MRTVQLGLKRLPETNEWKITWKEDGVYKEGPTYYTDAFDDAVMTAVAERKRLVDKGGRVSVTKGLYNAIAKLGREGPPELVNKLPTIRFHS
jgi:hypothetical protein